MNAGRMVECIKRRKRRLVWMMQNNELPPMRAPQISTTTTLSRCLFIRLAYRSITLRRRRTQVVRITAAHNLTNVDCTAPDSSTKLWVTA